MAEPISECSFEGLIQSKLFTFYIGKQRKRFVTHSKAIAATSQPFNALVNNDMVESQTASVDFEDVEPEDFVRFLEYAYRRDYTVPSWVQEDSVTESGDLEDTTSNAAEPPPPPEPEPEPEPADILEA